MDKTSILVADDHAVVRTGLKQLLEQQPDMEIAGEAADGQEALDKVRALHPDVTLIDIAMPRLNGLEALRLIKDASPGTQVVVFSMHKKEAYVHQAFTNGARGYVLKAGPSSELIEGIRTVSRGEYFLSSEMQANVIDVYLKDRKEEPVVGDFELLSEREQQVFRLVTHGNSTSEIAELLCVSPKTVEKHRSGAMKKLGVNNVVEMVKYAMKIGIIDPELIQE